MLCLLALAFAAPAQQVVQRHSPPYEVGVRLPSDGLYAGEESALTVRLTDVRSTDPVRGAAPVPGATLTATIDMPSMPGMPTYRESAHPESVPGEYGLRPTFPHGGEYRLRLAVTPASAASFTVEMDLPVRDATPAGQRASGPPPFRLELESVPARARAGEPVELRLRVRRRGGELVTAFERMHERLLHLILVRRDLGVFAHEHPELLPDGTFRLIHRFPTAGQYQVFADLAPLAAGNHVLQQSLRVDGPAPTPFSLRSATVEGQEPRQHDGTLVRLALSPAALPVGRETGIAFRLTGAARGEAVSDLEPYLGAMGHLILVHEDGTTFVHSHPDSRQAAAGRNGTVFFVARFPKPGRYRGWAQFQRRGKVLTSDFVFEAGEATTE